MRNLRVFTFLIALIGIASLAHAADRATCYTSWDERFLYAAFEVQDPDIESTNTTHMSNPWEDDAIEVFIETDAARAGNRTANTYQMSVSAGGGSNWQVGGPDGQPKPKTIYTFKFAKKLQGTLNSSFDTDLGYTIELAIPWSEMGGMPKPGQVMGFNVVCRMKGENDGFVSLSPDVKTAEDIQIPAKWSKIKFVDTPTIIAVQDGAVVCRKIVNQSPAINGSLGPGEWIRDLRFVMVKPESKTPVKQSASTEKLSLTPYYYWYQGDPRKEAPYAHVRYEDGSSMLTDHPLEGSGPWFSYDRVQWHKDQLAAMQQAGIDVALPVYRGDADDQRQFASKGLSCMTQAMKELKAEGKGFPLVGMFFDTTAMQDQYGEKPDLKSDEVKATFYGMIKGFFLHVPDELRATVQLPADKGSQPACIVVLRDASSFSDLDGSFMDYCNKRFDEDFGRKLVWVGGFDYKPKAKALDGYAQYGAGLGLTRDNSGWLDVASIGAGYDDSAIRDIADHKLRARADGKSFNKDWGTLMPMPPNWVIVDGWNRFEDGSEITPSAEYGDRYAFLTRLSLLKFNGMRPYDAKFLKHDTPSTMIPGAMYQVTLTIKNAGVKPWYPGLQGVFLTARWFKDGSLYADTSIRLPFQQTVLAGQTVEKTIGIRTLDQDGKPLPEGPYELRWELVRAHDEWFATGGDAPLALPVNISSAASSGFGLVGSSLPALMKSGATYSVKLKIRNNGSTPWKAGAKVGYRIYKTAVHLGKDSEDTADLVGGNESATALAADVEPGRVEEVTIPVAVVGTDGKPLQVSSNDLSTYAIQWDVNDNAHQLGLTAIGHDSEAFAVTSTDFGPKFISGDAPAEMSAGKAYPVSITIQNTGTDTWAKADSAIGYHWYYLDGTEAVWDGKKTPLLADLPAGQQATIKTSVIAPPFDGQYRLVCDLAVGDKWASTSANTRGGDILVTPVNVIKGKLLALDLDKLYDADVISSDMNPSDGDADGAGCTLPSECLPPVVTDIKGAQLWPDGLWASAQGTGLDSPRHIAFKYPSKLDGLKNAIACKGQSIPVKAGKYSSAHLLVLATDKVAGAEFAAAYGTAKAATKSDFASWTEAPAKGMLPAFVCLHRHALSGDQLNQRCWLTDYSLPADPKQAMTAIILPNSPALKVMAITLERSE